MRGRGDFSLCLDHVKFSEGGLPEFFLTKIRSKFFRESPVENISCRAFAVSRRKNRETCRSCDLTGASSRDP